MVTLVEKNKMVNRVEQIDYTPISIDVIKERVAEISD
jgi:hypothetical protein